MNHNHLSSLPISRTFNEHKKNFEMKASFAPVADYLHEILPPKLRHLVPYRKVESGLTWRDIVIALQNHDGGLNLSIEYQFYIAL